MPQFKKEVGELIRYAKKHGFHCEGMNGAGHWRLRHHGGQILIVPATPSKGRWRQNAVSQIKRIDEAPKESE
jgi:hypothetical protein